ncbi:GNAT family N-acetyltransferase [Kribbella capetownensis]|uniref:GNAT family N-acetyltransferase n=1 Tax=Kribbella capetownensis TaxID=1572659 RepID=A0A4R0JMT4_9ACTN|nr:GNAT family N-acetyltransferase [Kribbella capetownensis]TCC47707.1 GNAT family N-acetyltransferase [Kribbella capetownensis]
MFREADAGDFDAVMRLYRQLHPRDSLGGREPEVFAEILRTPGLRLFVLEVDGVVVATTYFNLIPNLTRGGAPYAVVENVVVDADRRGTGLGKQIMAHTLQAAWDAGCYKVMLMTGSRTHATHQFYKACGFDPGEKTAYISRPAR